jgi:carbonic anhydrase/SulP family sulfate permease
MVPTSRSLARDLTAGLVVFLVALPLCLGVALASGAPLFAGIVAGVVGGIVVGSLSGSQTSVSGPAAGLTAVVAAEIAHLGSFEAFLSALVIAGLIQVVLGILRAGVLAEFFPTSVIQGLLAAIGMILILKQIPHLVGHDTDPEGEFSFFQPDRQNTFSELVAMLFDLHAGAIVVGLASLALLIGWSKLKPLKHAPIPSALAVVGLGVAGTLLFQRLGGIWTIGPTHLVQVPVADSPQAVLGFLRFPDTAVLGQSRVWIAALTVAIVASLETLLNLEAVDRIDPRRRVSPPNRELLAQGAGNILSGLLGGLPVTSVIVRSSVNILAANESKLSAIFHGILLAVCVIALPTWLNLIPLSALAAILIFTGYKLASANLFRRMWRRGPNQFLPFVATVSAILLTDLLVGILIGLAISTAFILQSSFRHPFRTHLEKHVGGDVTRVELSEQISFLNKAALQRALRAFAPGQHVLLDARSTAFMDPDVEDVLQEFAQVSGPARGVHVSLVGFQRKAELDDRLEFAETSNREVQDTITPDQVLALLREGNDRFRSGRRLPRNLTQEQVSTASGQFPLAVVLGCIDSRTPSELVFDAGLGDVFSVRIAGNVAREKVLGSLEYACAVAGAKLVVVMGHTSCGAVNAAVAVHLSGQQPEAATGCDHLNTIISDIQLSIRPDDRQPAPTDPGAFAHYADEIARRNVCRVLEQVRTESAALARLEREGRIKLCGAMYDVGTGVIEFL